MHVKIVDKKTNKLPNLFITVKFELTIVQSSIYYLIINRRVSIYIRIIPTDTEYTYLSKLKEKKVF